jgi:hypothetical protein
MGILETDFATEEQIETRATSHAFALIAVAADPAATKQRLSEISAATKEHAATRDAAAATIAEVETKQAALAAAAAAHAETEGLFNARVEVNERKHRQREEAIRAAQDAVANRERDCSNREAELKVRVAEHEALMRRLKAHVETGGA